MRLLFFMAVALLGPTYAMLQCEVCQQMLDCLLQTSVASPNGYFSYPSSPFMFYGGVAAIFADQTNGVNASTATDCRRFLPAGTPWAYTSYPDSFAQQCSGSANVPLVSETGETFSATCQISDLPNYGPFSLFHIPNTWETSYAPKTFNLKIGVHPANASTVGMVATACSFDVTFTGEPAEYTNSFTPLTMTLANDTVCQACEVDADCDNKFPTMFCSEVICTDAGTCQQRAKRGGNANVCRPATTPCDVPEYCDGFSYICPADLSKTDAYSFKVANELYMCQLEGQMVNGAVDGVKLTDGVDHIYEMPPTTKEATVNAPLQGPFGIHVGDRIKVPMCLLDNINQWMPIQSDPELDLGEVSMVNFFQCDLQTGTFKFTSSVDLEVDNSTPSAPKPDSWTFTAPTLTLDAESTPTVVPLDVAGTAPPLFGTPAAAEVSRPGVASTSVGPTAAAQKNMSTLISAAAAIGGSAIGGLVLALVLVVRRRKSASKAKARRNAYRADEPQSAYSSDASIPAPELRSIPEDRV